MKKIVLLICFAWFSIGAFAQHGPREKIKAFKIAYITEKLDLTSKEAQQFWPVYNVHEETVQKLRRRERKLIKSIKEANNTPTGLSDKQAKDAINNFLEVEEQKSQSRKNLILDLKKVMPNTKILKLIKAEADFHKRMLARIKERRKRH
ncbi:hypothetical protein ATE84_2545 [Aquimarina sp. MAR_2010_214]|uniref:sensor of ECF-type sigma factor n=1 Tax=Aquimarina sp. MAR_2010_214 TaxID=1250026 RepID=UPI000C71291F|nr:sensor of ECF-type sigma factor [Aquimarina sp. MAR_2010_214]PKV50487.1 hypothetical protein ATE84_2545 [Aquimarina sp. MAR_2010_214]